MKRWKAFLLVGMVTMGFQMWSWFLGALLAAFGLAQGANQIAKKLNLPDWVRVLGTGGYGAYSIWQEKKEEQAQAEADAEAERYSKLQPYQRSEFMPGQEQGPMSRYSPQGRQPQASSQLQDYLRSFTQPR